MHLYFDSLNDFTEHCCALLQVTDQRGPACTDWLEIATGKHGHDLCTAAYLSALRQSTRPEDVAEAFATNRGKCLAIGLAHHALLADTAFALIDGLFGPALLARLAPHFPDIDLTTLSDAVKKAEAAYRVASRRDMQQRLDSLGGSDKDRTRAPLPPAPLHHIQPDAPAIDRAAALLWQLEMLLQNTRPPGEHPLAPWQIGKQLGSVARFIENYCQFETPPDLPRLIKTQHQLADHALQLKIQLLQTTLLGIVTLRLPAAVAGLAAHFDGDLPGLPMVRWLTEPEYANSEQTLQITSIAGPGHWRITCAGSEILLAEADCRPLMDALNRILNEELGNQQAAMQIAFGQIIERLQNLDDRSFQGFLRETQSSTLELILSALPEQLPDDVDTAHPLYDKVGRNISQVVWEIMKATIAQLGLAPLDAFELAIVLGELLTTDKTLKLKLTRSKASHPTPKFALNLPDIRINEHLALCERTPRNLVIFAGESEPVSWKITPAELRQFAAQLSEREVLRQSDSANFAHAWLSRWLEQQAREHPTRRRRFLRSLNLAEVGDLLQAATPDVRTKWLEVCSTTARDALKTQFEKTQQMPDWTGVARRFFSHEQLRTSPTR